MNLFDRLLKTNYHLAYRWSGISMSNETANHLFDRECLLKGEYVPIVTHVYCPDCLDFYPKYLDGQGVLCPDCQKLLAAKIGGEWVGIGDQYDSLVAYLAESENTSA